MGNLKMTPLTIKDIKEWLSANESEFKKLKEEEFPPTSNDTYLKYCALEKVMGFFSLTDKTHIAVQDFLTIETFNLNELIQWTKTYETLGADDLVLFEVEYFDWKEDVDKELMKIGEGMYMEIAPFKETLLFCRIFQILYWDYNIIDTELTNEEIKNLQKTLLTLLNEN